VSPVEDAPKERASAQKALAIDDSLAEAHAVLAGADQDLWEWDAAEREYRRSLELDPNNGNAHHWYGIYLDANGRHEEALTQFKRALEVDPLNLTFNTTLASSYGDARQYDLALDQFKKTIEIDPNYASAHDNLARAYRNMEKYELWLEEWKKAATLTNDREDLAIAEEAARVYTKSGFRSAIGRTIELRKQLSQRRYVDPADIAYAYATLGDKNQAFYWLERAYSQKSSGLQFLKVAKPSRAVDDLARGDISS